jgi:hypothetical protein
MSSRTTAEPMNPVAPVTNTRKLAAWASALADVLRRRGLDDPAASLTAEAGIAVFRVALERWVDDTEERDLAQLIRESLDELRAVSRGDLGRQRARPARVRQG